MKQLLVAACLAVGIHVALFSIRPQWTAPSLLMPQSRSVTISLVDAPSTPPQKAAPPPVVKPKPKEIPKPKPVKAPAPEPAPLPEIQAAAPEQQRFKEEFFSDETQAHQPLSPQEGAVIQSSVPRYDINPTPIYPPVARRRGYEGTVLLEVIVTPEGRAGQVTVVQSSGYAILDRRARSTVQKWLFTPAMRGPDPVQMRVEVPIVFKFN